MAQNVLKRSRKIICILGFLSIMFLVQNGNAFQFKVGGSSGTWTVPSDPNIAIYNQWAENNRFQIGDTLLFVYAPEHDSVLHVTKDDFTNCSTSSPLEKFSDGHTIFHFNQSGPHYFISGSDDNCRKNEKMIVVVMEDRSKRQTNEPVSPSSPPSPSAEVPTTSPAPSGEESPSPPPANPGMAPPGNGVSSIVTGLAKIIAAFGVSSFLLAV